MGKIYKVMLNKDAVVCVIDGKDIVEEAIRLHTLSLTAAAALGRSLIAGAFMGSALKDDAHKLSVTIDGGGGLGKITVAANNKSVRGFVTNPTFDCALRPDGKLNVGEAVGRDGHVTVIKDLGMKEPYVGKTELATGEIAEDFAYYFTVSEQSPSAVALGVKVTGNESGRASKVVSSGGIFVQPLPGCDEFVITMLEDIVKNFTSVTDILEKMSPEEIIDYYFGAFELKKLAEQDYEYKCNCSKERMDGIVASLGRNELDDIIATQGKVEIRCEFCSTVYSYESSDVDKLFEEK